MKREEVLKKLMDGGPEDFLRLLLGGKLGDGEKIYDASVERTGDKIILPEGANLGEVIDVLQRQREHEEQVTMIHYTIPAPPWDGAQALMKAIETNTGVFLHNGDMGGAHQIDVEVDYGKTIAIPWGKFELAGMEGAVVTTDTTSENGLIVFQCHVRCKRKYEERARRILELARDIASKESLHRGKAFSMKFFDEDGDQIDMPTPTFFKISPEEPIFNRELADAIERNVLVPIRYSDALREQGQTLKRGILFAGEYGVGKTMLSSYIARMSTQAGWTFIYVKDSKELPDALKYAQQFQPAVVFAEDIDRVAGAERTDEVNELLNQLDGIDSKNAEIIAILTTNHPERINDAMGRPGRIDMVINVSLPDADTAGRMIMAYGNDSLVSGIDVSKAAAILAGQIPARIREAINRGRLEALRRTNGDKTAKVSAEDLEAAAKDIKAEAATLSKKKPTQAMDLAGIGDAFVMAGSHMKNHASVRRGSNGDGRRPEHHA